MPNVLRNPYSNTAGNVPSSLSNGQIGVNQADGKLFYRASNGTVTQFSSGGGSSSLVVAANVSAFPATGSASVLYLAEDTSRLYQWEDGVWVEVGGTGGGVTHAATHATGGGDEITPAAIGAAAANHTHAYSSLTGTPSSFTPSSHASSHASGGTDALSLAASQITSGTISDARLSANVTLLPAMMLRWSESSGTAIDVIPRPGTTHNNVTLVSGSVYWTFFTPLVQLTVSQITMGCLNTAASGLTLARMGIFTYDESTATLVARTASDTTLFTSTRTLFTRSLDTTGGYPATYTLVAGTRYGVAVICTGTTMPALSGVAGLAEIVALSPRVSAVRSSQSDLGTLSSVTTGSTQYPWARLS